MSQVLLSPVSGVGAPRRVQHPVFRGLRRLGPPGESGAAAGWARW